MAKPNQTRRRMLATVAATLVLPLTVVACGDDDNDEDAIQLELVVEGRDQTVTLIDTPGRRVAPPGSDLDESKETPGDLAIQEAILRNSSGEEIGQIYSVFTTVGDPGIEQVTGTIRLDDGDIIGQGMIGRGTEDELAILGGTGRYGGTSGTMSVSQEGERAILLLEFEG